MTTTIVEGADVLTAAAARLGHGPGHVVCVDNLIVLKTLPSRVR